jgi:TonB family protein
MSDKEKNIIYTARDIEQYLAGNLSSQQMHAIEKAALNDPFLAEAMEGYEAVKDKEWNNQLVALREEISNKGAVAKVIPLHKTKHNWWKAAAAVIIIGAGASLPFILNKDKKEDADKIEIAQTVPVTKDSVIQIDIPSPASVTQSLNPSASASKEDKKAIVGTVAQVETKTSKTESGIILEPGAPVLKPAAPIASDEKRANDKVIATAPTANGNQANASENADVVREMNAEKNKSADKQNNEAETILARQRSQGAATAKKEALLNNFFTAQVVAADNTPLPFTNISIKKENFGTYADAKGMVRLVSTDSVLNIEVRSVGYQPKIFALRNNQTQTKIILQEEEVALKDRKIIGNTTARKFQQSRRAMLLKDSAVNVEPADGWDNYNTYVANNLDIPESALNNYRHGEVELSFDVKANGTVSNIRVNKSLGAEYDEAAKRLIQEGPQWKVKKGKKTSASVKVQF